MISNIVKRELPRTSTSQKTPIYVTDVVNNNNEYLEVLENTIPDEKSKSDKKIWHKEKDDPNGLVYMIFDSRDYGKYFVKNSGWIHIRYFVLEYT